MKAFIFQGLEVSEMELEGAIDLVDTNGVSLYARKLYANIYKDGMISPDEFMAFMGTLTQGMSYKDFEKSISQILI
jgi:hypothetical protein